MQELVQITAKNSSKLNKFLHSEVNLLIQHIIVQDQDGQNNNMNSCFLIPREYNLDLLSLIIKLMFLCWQQFIPFL